MQYVLTLYMNTAAFAARHADGPAAAEFWAGWRAYGQALEEAGVNVDGSALQPPESATTVRVANGARTIHDGPYADTKEQIGGYVLIDVPSLDVALDWAARCPAAAYGAVEVRPVLPRPR
ncbi:MAG TPA: YciI family protein [Candidatus Limnocylindria bacterium]|jgi:hypothetical protein|nr:YciI family protein [Candidatus Limnocylindria bacterium]